MSKKYAITAVIVFVLFGLTAPCVCANLLTDGSFEGITSGTYRTDGIHSLSNWRYFSVSGAGGSLLAMSPGLDGNIAIRLTRTYGGGDTGLDRDSQRVPALPYHRYRATVWARSDAGSQIMLKFAAHDAGGAWLGVDAGSTFGLTTVFAAYSMDFTAPAGAALLNFAIRVVGSGSLIVDSCSITDLGITPAPQITYPSEETVDSFRPVIAFTAIPHEAYQAIITSGSSTVWDSGEVISTAFKLSCPTYLQPETSYAVKVRIRGAYGWSDYGETRNFTTPAAPIVRITTPMEADTIRGPSVRVRWTVDSPTSVTSQQISLDGGSPTALTTTTRSRLFSGITEGIHTASITATTSQGTTTDTSRFHVRTTPAPTGVVYFYDLTYLWSYQRSDPAQAKLIYDTAMAVSALQGIVNRSGPRLYIKFWGADDTWWQRLRESGNWLANKTQVTLPTGLANIATLFNTFRSDYQGAVVWDPNVNATSNVACTVAGADDLIPIRYDPTPGSIYDILVQQGPQLPVLTDLTNKFTGTGNIWGTGLPSTGSKKNDAYIWARTNYLGTGKSNPNVLMYAVDGYWLVGWQSTGFPGFSVLNRDYVVQKRGFAYDLSVWGDEKPVDDPNQTLGLDLNTHRSILSAAAARATGMIHVVDAKPWPMKYTNHESSGGSHEPVPYEWECIRWFTAYNAYSDADSYAYVDMTNASIHGQFPLPDRLTQNRPPSLTDLRKLGYIDTNYNVAPLNFLNLYIGDYDSAAWMLLMGTGRWDEAYRGSVTMSWPFNPNLIDRGAAFFEYFNRTRTSYDSFICGNSGAGYVNPSRLFAPRDSGLPSAHSLWARHNLDYFRKANLKISGFLINGTAGALGSNVDSMFSQFSVDGTFSQPGWYPQGDHMVGSMPAMLQRRDLTNDATTDAGIIGPDGQSGQRNFLNYRTVLVGPNYVNTLFTTLTSSNPSIPWALVDTPTYAALNKASMSVVHDCRATYSFDLIPSSVRAGEQISASVGVRNDGWIDWNPSGTQPVTLVVKWKKGALVVATASCALPKTIRSGGAAVLDIQITAPSAPGSYVLTYEIARQGIGFSELGDYCWEKSISVDLPLHGGTTDEVKAYPDGTVLTLRDAVATAGTNDFSGFIYVENRTRTSGLRVSLVGASGISVNPGDVVEIVGTLSTTESGERVLIQPTLISKVSPP